MMMDSGASLTIPVPSIITSSPSGGRFDFDDGGTYCGGWQDGKAHGHGICTGPKNVGEYSGSWNFGFEMSGVYRWKNGSVYEGRWQNGKRHGVGVEYNGKWIYRGEWSQGYKGRYGVKASSNSAVKYEGTWANGLQDGYGSETYSDGGFYQGQMCRGLRHGYGVRKSAPYGDSQLNNPNKNGQMSSGTGLSSSMLIHSNSLQSSASVDLDDPESPKPEDGFKPHIERTLASKNGFVLVAKPLDVPMSGASNKFSGDSNAHNSNVGNNGKSRRNSLTNKLASSRIPGSNQTASLLRGLRLRKQKSTSDLDAISGGGRQTPGGRSSAAASSSNQNVDTPIIPFSLSPEELDITDPTTVETYTGEWKHDKRNGHGICERSDGLKYEGQWHNDMKCGYGVTTFKDGTKEEGKYKNNILMVDSKVKRFFQLGSANIRQRIDEAVKMAHQTQTMALKKAEIADTRAATARDKAEQAGIAAMEADRDSQIAYSVANQYSTSSQQQFGMGSNVGAMFPMGQPLGPLNFAGNPMGINQLQHSQQQQQANSIQHSIMGVGSLSQPTTKFSQQELTRFGGYNQSVGIDHNQTMTEQQQQQQHNADSTTGPSMTLQKQQYLGSGPAEPFNGRRGSFRGSSSQQPTIGHSGSNQHRTTNANQIGGHLGSSAGGLPMQRYNQLPIASNRSTTDTFNDIFEHYKATGNFPKRKPMFRQTSLDYNKMRSSVPRHLGSSSFAEQQQQMASNDSGVIISGNASTSRSTNPKLFRMSSMDHAEENQRQTGEFNPQTPSINLDHHQQQSDPINNPTDNNSNSDNIQQQFKHLVTSGEDLQQHQQQQQQQVKGSGSNHRDIELANSTTGSSFILPQSTNSSFFGNPTQTPSQLSDGAQSTSFRPQSGQFYEQQQQQQQQQQSNMYNYSAHQQNYQYAIKQQRDVHSLADEQLYAVGRRLYGDHHILRRSDYSNYDFTISSSPPLSRRLMRRTASLSRNTPIKSKDQLRKAGAGSTTLNASLAGSRLIDQASRFQRQRSRSPGLDFQDVTQANITSGGADCSVMDQPNHQSGDKEQEITSTSHLLAPENNSMRIIRKPSLQTRYDPSQLGGLMTREAVAALSHAQREQRRLEAEKAEQRAKRPLYHLYMSLGEFISQRRFILAFCVFNLCLAKMFVDLITG